MKHFIDYFIDYYCMLMYAVSFYFRLLTHCFVNRVLNVACYSGFFMNGKA